MLEYETANRVRAADAKRIVEEALALQREWWRGPLAFDDPPEVKPAILSGAAPLFHHQGVSDEDDLFMAFADVVYLVERLAGWASRFNLKWILRMNGEAWGTIDSVGCGAALLKEMRRWGGAWASARGPTGAGPSPSRAAARPGRAGAEPCSRGRSCVFDPRPIESSRPWARSSSRPSAAR